jgi:hypothetical protein
MDHMGEYNAAKELAEEFWPDWQAHKRGRFCLIDVAAKRGLSGHVASNALSYLNDWEKHGKERW